MTDTWKRSFTSWVPADENYLIKIVCAVFTDGPYRLSLPLLD